MENDYPGKNVETFTGSTQSKNNQNHVKTVYAVLPIRTKRQTIWTYESIL
jgi:hypothetical protein